MKVAIFDGILETHVGDSLERAFMQRGHTTMNTGKIGSGFKFPNTKADLTHLDFAVAEVLAFNPDVIFVMRPASLPFPLLKKIRSRGATMMAWFSDDPVLFDLSYGPIVDLYDHVLHCGNATVLQFYENYFQRPTGVNIPFWTDHQAFPRVWGSEEADTNFLFLGNVQDEVRRKRYFELADLPGGVRIHGNIGADYFGISGGYLDSDEEVVASAARTKIALNIPQFFENHRGLETWFSGLDSLGFFEYPSRVVQYMAMGLPTISIIPQQSGFRSYPEMIIADSVADAGAKASELMVGNQLEVLSNAVSQRFDKNFSALSRVMAVETLLEDDSWRRLDPQEREVWFTQFDATEVSAPITETSTRESPKYSDYTISSTARKESDDVDEQVVVFGLGGGRPTSRFNSIAGIFKDSGYAVREIVAEEHERLLVEDPAGICASAINAARVLKLLGPAERTSTIIVCGVQAALTDDGLRRFTEAGYRLVMIDDSGTSNSKKIARMRSKFDVYATSACAVSDALLQRGFKNVLYLPHLINPEFKKELEGIGKRSNNVVHLYKDSLTEESVCPAIAQDLNGAAVDAEFTFDDLRIVNLKQLAQNIAAEVAVVSYEGTRANPKLNELMPYAVVASNVTFFSRHAVHERIYPYNESTILVGEIGELKIKVQALSTSPALQALAERARKRFLNIMKQSEQNLIEKVKLFTDGKSYSEAGIALSRGRKYLIPVVTSDSSSSPLPNSAVISFQASSWIGDRNDWWVRIRRDGSAVYGQRLESQFRVFLADTSSLDSVEVECEYLGPDVNISQLNAVDISAEVKMDKSLTTGGVSSKAVLKTL